jgi:hypothetical protein
MTRPHTKMRYGRLITVTQTNTDNDEMEDVVDGEEKEGRRTRKYNSWVCVSRYYFTKFFFTGNLYSFVQCSKFRSISPFHWLERT